MSFRAVSTIALMIVLLGAVAGASPLPGPAEAEWDLTAVPGSPNAPAVYLERSGVMHYDEDYRSSWLEIYARVKILTEEGTDFGSISMLSSDHYRVKNVVGRTLLPDGREVELDQDATFKRHYSDYFDTMMVSVALPEVVPGAIIEYRYRTYFDGVFYPRDWYFQSDIPTLVSRIAYELPNTIRFAPIRTVTLRGHEIEEAVEKSRGLAVASYTMRDMPAVPDEPSRYPFSVLSSRMLMLPLSDDSYRPRLLLFESWERVCQIAWGNSHDYGYLKLLKDDGATSKQARELTAGLSDARAKAAAIYRFVRDEIETADVVGIWGGDDTVDAILDDRRGSHSEKALLLYAMLDAVKLHPELAWASPRTVYHVNPKLPNPSQFEDVLVRLELGGDEVWLDPTDRSLAFGALRPSLQAVQVLLPDKKNPSWATTPMLPASASTRIATVDLALDADGVLTGTATIEPAGNHAWRRLLWHDTADETRSGWQAWIEDRYPGFEVDDVTVTEDVEHEHVTVSWHLAQLAEEALGDEASVAAAQPLAITSNPYTLPPGRRMTPLQLLFPDTDEVELHLSWPEGWVVDAAPEARSSSTGAGSYETTVQVDPAARTATYHRSVALSGYEFVGGQAYAGLRTLYEQAAAADAQAFLLVAE